MPKRMMVSKGLTPYANNPATQARFYEILDSANPPKFCIGDEVTFQKADGWTWVCGILGFREDGTVDGMTYDGNPHHVIFTVNDLDALRVISIRTHDEETVNMYRRWVGLDVEGEVA